MFKSISKTILCLISILFFSQAVASKDLSKTILYIGDSHLSQAKKNLLIDSANKSGLKVNSFSSRQFRGEKHLGTLCDYPMVILQAMNSELASAQFSKIQPAMANCNNHQVTIGFPVGNTNSKTKPEQQKIISDYLSNGMRINYENVFSFIGNAFFNLDNKVSPPVILPKVAAYHPDYPKVVSSDSIAFFNWLNTTRTDANSPSVGVLIHRSTLENEQTQLVDNTIKAIEDKGGKAFGIFFDGSGAHEKFVKLATSRVAALINYRMLHEAEQNKQDFMKIGVPVIQGLIFREGNRAEFEKADAGISAMMSPYFLMMPESAGVIDPTMIATIDKVTKTSEPMPDHVKAIAERALLQASLSSKSNGQKKLSLFMWNYPSGDKNMGAAFLNVPQSISEIVESLKVAGYTVKQTSEKSLIENVGKILRPFYTESGLNSLMEQGLSDHLPVSDYMAWFNTLPKSVSQPILERWGDPSQHKYVRSVNDAPSFIIPQIKLGNLIVMPQPGRSEDKDENTSLYHSTSSPIGHYYLAVYLYTRSQHKSDAIINLGTHGSQEWLIGKERGLSIYDAPQLTVGNIPVFYPFIMDNVGEAMQAKRRGRATMLSHMTPGFAQAGFYGELGELEELIEQYMTLVEGKTRSLVQKNIKELAIKLKVFEDIDMQAQDLEKDFDIFLHILHDYLHTMSAEAQPLGLHTYGQTLNDPHSITTAVQMLGSEFIERASDYEHSNNIKLTSAPDLFSQNMEDNGVTQLDDTAGFKLLWASLIEKQSLNLNSSLTVFVEQGQEFLKRIRAQQEMQNLIKGLDGEMMPVGYGGDPVRSHDAMPTGINLLGFNPAKVPSKAAWQVGKQLVEDVIAKHYQEKGEYPDKLAFSLWSLETMRHHGVLESQILAAMGVRPKWDKNGFLRGTEVIPYNELKRPRVDVVASATGLYRDAFPNVMLMLAKAVEKVAKLKEENNSIYANTLKLKSTLLLEGKTEDEANYLSTVRLFSNESGSYGSGLASTSLASDTWDKDSKLSNLYLKRMGYAFGSDANRWSEKVSGLYEKTLSGTDAVLFSRSSNLYGMNTSDDPFQYFGGMALAIRNIDGASPDMFIANLREKNNAKSESFNRFMARELRNRSFHPRWIEEAQKEGYSGASMMLDRLNNFWGWTVMYPEGVTNNQWQEFAEVYVKDKYDLEMREFFEKSNPTNLAQMIERMLEAERKEYWQTDEATLKKLVETYLEIKRDHAVFSENEAFKDNLTGQAKGFGLTELLEQGEAVIQQELIQQAANNSEMVEGQKLEQVESVKVDSDFQWQTLFFSSLILLAFIAGVFQQLVVKRQLPEA